MRFTPRNGRVMLPGSDAFCQIDATFDVAKTPTLDIDPITAGTQTAQIVDNSQFYGALSASGRGSSSSPVTIKSDPKIATTASPDIALGGAARRHRRPSAAASARWPRPLDFRLYGPDDADLLAPARLPQSLNRPYPIAGGLLSSEPYKPTAAGTYRWRASYSGEANNAAITAPCNDAGENVVVKCSDKPGCPTIATTASRKSTKLVDTAVVSGRVSPQASTVDFRLYGPDDPSCSGTPVFESLHRPYPVAGGPVESQPYTPAKPGIHRWVASYSGHGVEPERPAGVVDEQRQRLVQRLNGRGEGGDLIV